MNDFYEQLGEGMFTDPAELDATRERIIAEMPERFAIWHFDASPFVDEVAHAAGICGLEQALVDGEFYIDAPFVTDDPEKVEKYRGLMSEWGWIIHDKLTRKRIENTENGVVESDVE